VRGGRFIGSARLGITTQNPVSFVCGSRVVRRGESKKGGDCRSRQSGTRGKNEKMIIQVMVCGGRRGGNPALVVL